MKKLRRFYNPSQLTQIYSHTYSPDSWPEHRERVARTIEIAQQLIDEYELKSVADLSCGNGAIVDALRVADKLKNDISTAGTSIEERVLMMEPVDLFICTETIEHIEAPWTVLEHVAQRTKWLLLSTPLDEDPSIGNYEHYWSFELRDVMTMLDHSTFYAASYELLGKPHWTYSYQIWTARGHA